MDENKNEPTENYSLVKSNLTRGFWKKTGEWFRDLFTGYWYGMTDLFLASWQNIVLLVMLLILPIIYGVVCALGYWNPISNLGKMEIPIFDQDRTFLKVQAKSNDGTYHIGALKEATIDGKPEDFIKSDNSINSDIKIGKDLVSKLSNDDTLTLNNGFVIDKSKYTDIQITPMNTWDLIKKNVLIKENPQKADTDSSFELAVYPNQELDFRNFKYVNDSNKINKYWQTGSYQAQIKIGDGYGAALVGLQGIAYDKDFMSEMANQDTQSLAMGTFVSNQNKLPIMDTFQTFQTNFVSAFVLGDMSEFASQIVDQMQPFTNAFKNNANADETFGTKGSEIINFLDSYKDAAIKKAEIDPLMPKLNINSDSYYLVSSEKDFVNSINVALKAANKKAVPLDSNNFGDPDGFDKLTLFSNDNKNGTSARWLDNVNYWADNEGYATVKADSSTTLKLVKNIEDMFNNAGNQVLGANDNGISAKGWEINYLSGGSKNIANTDTTNFVAAVREMMSTPNAEGTPTKNLIRSIIGTLSPIYKADKSNNRLATAWNKSNSDFKTVAPFATGAPFIPSSTANMFGLFTKMMNDNFNEFFNFLQPVKDQLASNGQDSSMLPVSVLGSAYGTMVTSLKANGADPSSLIHMEPSRGQDISVYGIGLGQMFIFLGLYIGFTMLRASINRNKQYAKLKWSNWYISKFLQYLTVGFVIATLITWIMYGAAWHQYISAAAMGYEYLWILMAMFPILAIIIGLQYATAPMIGAALAIIYLGLNITCSGASYPGWMELGFYRGITWVMPFKYLIEGSDQILYGVNLVNQHWGQTPNAAHVLHMANDRILELWGYASCFFAFFFFLGFFGAIRTSKVTAYGSARGKVVARTFDYLGKTNLLDKFVGTKINKKGKTVTTYNWKAIAGPFDPVFWATTRKLQKERMHFKWYKDLRDKRRADEMERYSNR